MASAQRADRQEALRRRIADLGLDALGVTHQANIRYLTGFTGSAGFLLLAATRTLLLTDPRYALQAPSETAGTCDVEIEPTNLWDRLGRVLADLRIETLGFEKESVTVRDAERLTAARAGRLEPTSGLVESLRVQKDPGEVESVRAAAALALEAFGDLQGTLRPGQTELEIAATLEAALRARGSEWHPFETIVASGERSALPHARSTRRAVRSGDFLLLDFGAQVDGYCSDLTRTVIIGRADGRQRDAYDAVRAAQQATISQVRAGMTGREADAIARSRLAAGGYSEAFRHSLGHGIGLELHEDPRLSPTANVALPPGAVVTIEPGVYFDGWGGVRLEDDVLLTPEGARPLSPGAPELLEI